MRPLSVILLLALVIRVGWALTRPTDLSALPDQIEYHTLASNLISGQGLVFTDPRFGTPSFAHRSPGYPLFVAAFGANITLVRLAQALLDTSTVLAAYLLARQLVPRTALIAAVLVALNPFLIYFSGLLLTETLFTSLLTWGMYLLIQKGNADTLPSHSSSLEKGSKGAGTLTMSFIAGLVLLALSVTVRPGAIVLPVLLAVVAAMTRFTLPKVPAGLTAAALTFAVLLPWAWRNHNVLNEWIFTASNAGLTAYDGFNPAADGSSNQAAYLPHMPELGQMTETQRNHYLLSLAAEYRAENPTRLVPLSVWKLLRTWSPMPLSAENRSIATMIAGLIYCVILWVLALGGMRGGMGILSRRTSISFGLRFLLLLPALYLTISAMASVGSLRYRIPADPLIAVLAAAGYAVLLSPKPATDENTSSVSS